jgi:hypothetical protein
LGEHIKDKDILWLISQVIDSFETSNSIYAIADMQKGLPLGNLTSQLLVNIYMNKFDQFMKHKIKAKFYIRYADDFVILSGDKRWLENILPRIKYFLENELNLSIHPKKVSITTVASGVDFLGWILFPDHRVVRTITKKRMFRGIRSKKGKPETVQSYLGLLGHGNTEKLKKEVGKYLV